KEWAAPQGDLPPPRRPAAGEVRAADPAGGGGRGGGRDGGDRHRRPVGRPGARGGVCPPRGTGGGGGGGGGRGQGSPHRDTQRSPRKTKTRGGGGIPSDESSRSPAPDVGLAWSRPPPSRWVLWLCGEPS